MGMTFTDLVPGGAQQAPQGTQFNDLVPNGGQPDPAAAQQPQDATQPQQQWQPPDQSGFLGGYSAASTSLLNTATLGLSDLAGGTAAWLISKATSDKPLSWNEAYGRLKQVEAKSYQQHPWLTGAGTVGGLVTGGGLLAKGVERIAQSGTPLVSQGAKAIGGALDTAGQPLMARAGKQFALGAGIGGASQMINNTQLVPDANTAVAALAGGTLSSAAGAALPTITSAAGNLVNKVSGAVNKVMPELAPAIAVGSRRMGITGPSAAASATGRAILPEKGTPTTRAWGLLADKIGLKPKELQDAINNYKSATGATPTLHEIMAAKQSGALRAMADNNPALAADLQANAANIAAGRPQQFGGLIGDMNTPQPLARGAAPVSLEQVPTSGMTKTQTINDIIQTRTATADAMMAPIKDKAVPVNGKFAQDVLMNPILRHEIPAGTELGNKIAATVNDLTGADGGLSTKALSNRMTVSDIEGIRRAMQSASNVYANPASPKANYIIGKELKSLVTQIGDTGAAAQPVYKEMLGFVKNAHDYQRGFEHGAGGKALGDITKADVAKSVTTDPGKLGYRAGLASHFANKAAKNETAAGSVAKELAQTTTTTDMLNAGMGAHTTSKIQKAAAAFSQANQALARSTPPAIRPQSAARTSDAVLAGIEGSVGMLGVGMARGARYIREVLGVGRVAPAVEKRISKFLTSNDPRAVAQGMATLSRVGASEAERRQILRYIAGVTGAAGAQEVMPPRQ